ncbi:MAG: S9 family peptidase [Planctomycetes bacterium]|nr:S9 family peptidase [Planctomycetota bacterium]NOG54479.1 S9 family peptidase [Planctomycetota bacterium]
MARKKMTKKTTAKSTKSKPRARRQKKALIKPEDLTKLHLVSGPQVSPDGSQVAFVKKHVGTKNEYVTNLWLVPSAGDAEPRQFTTGGRDASPRWSPDGKTIAFIGARDKRKPQIFTISTEEAGGEATPLTKFPEGVVSSLKWSPDGRWIAATFRAQHPDLTEKAEAERKEKGLNTPPRVIDHEWYRLDGDGYFLGQRFKLYLIDTKTGKHRVIYDKDTLGFFYYDWAPDSKRLVVSTNRSKRAMFEWEKCELVIVDIKSGKVKAVPNLPEGPKDSVAWSPDGQWLAYAGRIGTDSGYSTRNLELFVCSASSGGAVSLSNTEDFCLMAAVLSDTAEVSFDAVVRWAPSSTRLYASIGWHGQTHLAAVDIKVRAGKPSRTGKFNFLTSGAAQHSLGNFSDDGKTFAFMYDTPTTPAEIAVGQVQARGNALKVSRVTNFNRDWIRSHQIAKPKSQWITSPDGNKVHVWVMRPPNISPQSTRKRPAVLEIHGGPHAQYGECFFLEFQVLAAEGYTVFYSNPRGSKGYGEEHTSAIRGSWGYADWVDMQAVMEFMKSTKGVDSKRMGIMGGSYGGYMTNWAIAHTNEFAAAITDRCVSNLLSMAGNSDFIDTPGRYWEGNAWDDIDARWNSSPIQFFRKVKTPTLIIHSEGDLRCNIEQSEQVFSALKYLKVPTRFVRYPQSTSHGMSRGGPPDMRLHRLHQITDWWQRFLKK